MVNGYEGVLPIYKPAGMTSHDVVAKVRRMLHIKRIGHGGTLDPQVTGVLPLCVGRATRVVEYMQLLPKAYVATLRLGIATDTEDMTGQIVATTKDVVVTEERISKVLHQFQGSITQIPPMYSAVKVNGKRLYELARQGTTVERKSRQAIIYDIKLLNVQRTGRNVDICFYTKCSKGTYIRTLCVDIGRALGYPAAMVCLERTMSADIVVDQCLPLDDVEVCIARNELKKHFIPIDQVISYMSAHVVQQPYVRCALQGQLLPQDAIFPVAECTDLIRLYTTQSLFLGIFKYIAEQQMIKPVKVFLPECEM